MVQTARGSGLDGFIVSYNGQPGLERRVHAVVDAANWAAPVSPGQDDSLIADRPIWQRLLVARNEGRYYEESGPRRRGHDLVGPSSRAGTSGTRTARSRRPSSTARNRSTRPGAGPPPS